MKSSGRNIKLTSYDDLFSTEESRADAQREKVMEIPLSELHPFKNHPFKVVDDEKMQDTAESIREYGVLVPAIARPREDGGYELVAGHRRKRGCELAGLDSMPVIIRDLDDDAATLVMVDSNIQRESILPSERAFAYKMKLDATVLISGLPTAKKWGYISEIPATTPPAEKPQKRRAWTPDKVFSLLEEIKDDKILHLAVHLAFVCSLRAGETAGIDLQTIDSRDSSLWITRQIQRVSDEAIEKLPRQEVIRVFPKRVKTSKSTLILKGPKTEGSHRKQYLTEPLMNEIEERLAEVQRCKDFFREEYHDYGLLLCQFDGRPLDPTHLEKAFKQRQRQMGIPAKDQIEFQGLRKSGQMHKVRLSQNNYQLVAENSGQSPEVLMSNYNEILDSEKRALAKMVEASFYPCAKQGSAADADTKRLLMKLRQNPELAQQILQSLLTGAIPAQSSL